jgi:putative membrane protein
MLAALIPLEDRQRRLQVDRKEFAMNTKCRNFAVLGAAAMLLPAMMLGQTDPNGNGGTNGYPQQGSGMSQSGGMNQQNGQPAGTGANPSQQGQPGSMRDSLGAPGETGQQMMDRQFLREAVRGDIAAVQMGKLATVKGGDAVKSLAQTLVDDHAAMNQALDTVADSMGVMLPKKMSKEEQQEYDTLNGLSGQDFDREYLTYTMKTRFAELHNFHMEASAAANSDLATEVVKQMKTMHEHVGLIVNVAKQDGVPLPPRPQRPAATTATK